MSAVVLLKDLQREGTPQPTNSARSIRRDKCRFAVGYAIRRGILGKRLPVLDVCCGDPYAGLFGVLRGLAWDGRYVGLDTQFAQSTVDEWKRREAERRRPHPVLLHSCKLALDKDDTLPLPPVSRHPFKEVATAFCIDALGKFAVKDWLVVELQRVAASIFVCGGATEDEMNRWGFQVIGSHFIGGEPELWGIWLDLRAEGVRRFRDRFPTTTVGHFAYGNRGNYARMLGVCQFCGHIDLTFRSRFGCVKCGKENSVRRPA